MRLANEIQELVRAGFSGLWVQSCEPEDALAELAQMCQTESWKLASWDIDAGLNGQVSTEGVAVTDPLSAVRSLASVPSDGHPTLLVLANFHRFLGSAEVIQALLHQVAQGKVHQRHLIILSPVVQLPVELERVFTVIEHSLPTRQQLEEIAASIAADAEEFPEGAERERILDAACGLSRYEAENAFALSLVRHGRIEPSAIWQLKSLALLKGGLLSLHRGGETFDDLGGLGALKEFCLRALRPGSSTNYAVKAKGVLLLGVPGTGKSALAKALGAEGGRPTLTLDVGTLMGGIVGETESRTRRALKIIDAMAPAVLFVDELEKSLSGTSGSGQTDSGVGSRMLGTLLTWLADHESDIFVIATSNDISKLPPELTRAERFDAIFFLDLPGRSQKDVIWQMYVRRFGLDASQVLPEDESWTGAEVRACCRLAALLDVSLMEAAKNVVPVAATSAESVQRLRNWSSGRCLSAESGGIYRADSTPSSKQRRRLSPNPESN
ncbi:AAA family ATPase [Bremerella sp. P1]|uniref:AAA family ATPase n=1 Tax=Bremerella sp. P1 TaxID=3026424 RepID=UPI002367E2A8|nr:AAA family ATPase [Bremerella sp. P1]WDI41026.1 AAA family ATPase [Bremerella sp. P1]